MKVRGLLLFALTVLSIIFVSALAWLSTFQRRTAGSFSRIFPSHMTEEVMTQRLEGANYYFAGSSGSKVFLVNTGEPYSLQVADTIAGVSTQFLNVNKLPEVEEMRPRVKVQQAKFYLSDGSIPKLLSGDLQSGIVRPHISKPPYFSAFIPTGGVSAIMRTMVDSLSQEVLLKISNHVVKPQVASNLLEKQVDGVFCTDGSIHYDSRGHVVYVYFYRNEFIYADTNLTLIYRGKTLDTISRAKIKVAKLGNTSTLTEPPVVVNEQSDVHFPWLFIRSPRQARNEDLAVFAQASVIDVYRIETGEYQFSFYIFFKGGGKLKEFKVVEGYFYALYDQLLVTYRLQRRHFPPS